MRIEDIRKQYPDTADFSDVELYNAFSSAGYKIETPVRRNAITAGLSSGVDQLQGSMYGLGGALTDAVGWDSATQWMQEQANRNQQEAAQNGRSDLENIEDQSFGSALPYAGYQFAKQVPMFASLAASTLIPGAQVTLPARIGAIVPRGLGGGGLEAGATFAARRAALEQGANLARMTATGGALGTGEMYNESVEAGDPSPYAAIAMGLPYGMAEAMVPAMVGGAWKGAAKQGARDLLLSGGVLKNMAREGARGFVGEMGTELGQNEMEMAFNPHLTDEQIFSRRLNSAVAGGLVGGGLGSVGGIPQGMARNKLAGELTPYMENPESTELVDLLQGLGRKEIRQDELGRMAGVDASMQPFYDQGAARDVDIEQQYALGNYEITHWQDRVAEAQSINGQPITYPGQDVVVNRKGDPLRHQPKQLDAHGMPVGIGATPTGTPIQFDPVAVEDQPIAGPMGNNPKRSANQPKDITTEVVPGTTPGVGVSARMPQGVAGEVSPVEVKLEPTALEVAKQAVATGGKHAPVAMKVLDYLSTNPSEVVDAAGVFQHQKVADALGLKRGSVKSAIDNVIRPRVPKELIAKIATQTQAHQNDNLGMSPADQTATVGNEEIFGEDGGPNNMSIVNSAGATSENAFEDVTGNQEAAKVMVEMPDGTTKSANDILLEAGAMSSRGWVAPPEGDVAPSANTVAHAAQEAATPQPKAEAQSTYDLVRARVSDAQPVDVEDAATDYDSDLTEGEKPFSQLSKEDQSRYVLAYIAYNDKSINAQTLARIFGDIADANRTDKKPTDQPGRADQKGPTLEAVQAAVPPANAGKAEPAKPKAKRPAKAKPKNAERTPEQEVAHQWDGLAAANALTTWKGLSETQQKGLEEAFASGDQARVEAAVDAVVMQLQGDQQVDEFDVEVGAGGTAKQTAPDYSELSYEELAALQGTAAAHNRRVENNFVSKWFPEVAKDFETWNQRKRDKWFEANLTVEQDDVLQSNYQDEETIRGFRNAVIDFDTESPAALGRSIAIVARNIDEPGFFATPEGATVKTAMRFAKDKGWSLDTVLNGMRARAVEWAGEDAKELFSRFFKEAQQSSAGQIKKLGASGTADGEPAFFAKGKQGVNGVTPSEFQRILDAFVKRYRGAAQLRMEIALDDSRFGPAGAGIKGAYYAKSGKIIFVVANHSDARDVQRTLAHEILGHFGLDLFTPQDKRRILDWVKGAAKSNPELKAIYDSELAKNSDTDIAAGETLARVSEHTGRWTQAFFDKIKSLWNRALIAAGLRPADFITVGDVRAQVRLAMQRLEANAPQLTVPTNDNAVFRTQTLARYIAGKSGELVATDTIHAVKKLAYSLASLHDLVAEFKGKLPAIGKWYEAVQGSIASRKQFEKDAEKIADAANKLKNGTERVNEFISKSTFEQKWGFDPEFKNADGTQRKVTIDPEMKRLYSQLTNEEKYVVHGVFKHGEAMLKVKRELMKQLGLSDVFNMGGGMEGPYAPLKRFGNYVGVLKSKELRAAEEAEDVKKIKELKADSNHYVVSYFDTLGQAKQFAYANEGKWHFSDAFEKSERVGEVQPMKEEVLQKVLAAVKMNKDVPGPAQAAMKQMIQDMYFQSIDEHNARTSGLERLNRAGYDQDMIRSFLSHARAEAGYLANLKHGGDINDQFYQMQASAKDTTTGKRVAQDEFNLIARHYAENLKYEETPWQDRAMALTSAWQLATSVGYHVTNAMQGIMVTIPKLAADFNNYNGAWSSLMDGYKTLGKTGWKGGAFDVDKVADVGLRGALQRASDMGVLDVGMEEDLTQFEATRTGIGAVDKASKFARGALHKLRQVSRAVETANRVASATAAYNMSRAAGKSVQESQDYAVRILQTTQGDFSRVGSPLLLKRLPKVMTQYRKYQFMMAALYVQAFRQVKWGSAEEKAIGKRMLMFKLFHTSMAAGLLGMPLMNLAAMVFGAMGGDDEPKDLERSLREWIGDEDLASLILHGPGAYLGLDMSSKLGDDKIFSIMPYADFDLTSARGVKDTIAGIAGPAASQAMKFADGVGMMKQGEYYKGLEKFMPKGVESGMKAFRIANEGFSLKNGDVMFKPEDINGMYLALDALGLPSSEMKRMEWLRGQQYEIKRFYVDHSKQIEHDYAQAKKDGDTEALSELRQDWMDLQDGKDRMRKYFGDSNDELKRQPLSTLLKYPQTAQKREKKLQRSAAVD